MAKIVASYNPNITYDAIQISRGKRILEDYYTGIWNVTYTNSEKGPHTKTHPLNIPQKDPNPLAELCPYTILVKPRLLQLLPP